VRYSNRFEAFPIHKKCFFIEWKRHILINVMNIDFSILIK
jgi:hypothetical protein